MPYCDGLYRSFRISFGKEAINNQTAADLARIFSNTHLKSNLNCGDFNVS